MNNLHAYLLDNKIYALVLTIVGWVALSGIINSFSHTLMDMVAYALLGWYWLGDRVFPQVQRWLTAK